MDMNALMQLLQQLSQKFGGGQNGMAFAGGSPNFRENMGQATLNPSSPTANPVQGMTTTDTFGGGAGPKPMQLGGGNPMDHIMRILQGGRPGGGAMRMQQF